MAVIRALSVFVIFCLVLALVEGNTEVDILHEWRSDLYDPNYALISWNPTLVNPCTWFHITCNSNNSVTRLDLGNAGLKGPIIPHLGDLTNLQFLQLYGNFFTGKIPASLGKLTRLVSLNLFNNQLSGSIPPNLGNLKSLRSLKLANNNLTGVIPPEIGKLRSLRTLNLYDNHLSGSIPSSVGNLKSLKFLRLNSNALKGDLPVAVLHLLQQGHLRILNVSHNLLAGSVSPTRSKGMAITIIIQDPRA